MRCFCDLSLSIARLSVIEEYLRIGPDADKNVTARRISDVLNKSGMVLYRTLVLERDTWNPPPAQRSPRNESDRTMDERYLSER